MYTIHNYTFKGIVRFCTIILVLEKDSSFVCKDKGGKWKEITKKKQFA